MKLLLILAILISCIGVKGQTVPKPKDRKQIRLNAIHYIELANNKRWGTFVDARDTLYIDRRLFVFDTVNLVYRRIATVTIHYTNH
jgi:hypothetical protein